jgi:hypothetical protein
MRTLLLIGMLAVSSSAWAQSPPPAAECWPTNHIDKVVVQMADGTTRRGSLLCLGLEEMTLVDKSAVGRFRLADVRRIRKAPDAVWDGAVIGAAIGLIPLVFGCPAECVLRTAGAYGLVGLVIDAVNSNMDTVYRPAAGKRAAVGFRVRF